MSLSSYLCLLWIFSVPFPRTKSLASHVCKPRSPASYRSVFSRFLTPYHSTYWEVPFSVYSKVQRLSFHNSPTPIWRRYALAWFYGVCEWVTCLTGGMPECLVVSLRQLHFKVQWRSEYHNRIVWISSDAWLAPRHNYDSYDRCRFSTRIVARMLYNSFSLERQNGEAVLDHSWCIYTDRWYYHLRQQLFFRAIDCGSSRHCKPPNSRIKMMHT